MVCVCVCACVRVCVCVCVRVRACVDQTWLLHHVATRCLQGVAGLGYGFSPCHQFLLSRVWNTWSVVGAAAHLAVVLLIVWESGCPEVTSD